jgi:type I restriction enzyme M protein
MRAKMVEQDWVEAVIGLGPNLFYNSPMESCLVVCNRNKLATRNHKVLFIDALNEITRERAQSFLKSEHQQRILEAFQDFDVLPGFAKVITLTELQAQAYNLSIPLYVKRQTSNTHSADSKEQSASLAEAWDTWQANDREFWLQMDALVEILNDLVTKKDKTLP